DTRLVVPNDASLREALLTEAHSSPFSAHSGSTKMYHDLKQHFWCSGMKRDPLDIPVWKWDEISMDFVTGLPRTQRRHDAIWVVVDRLTMSAHFLPICKNYSEMLCSDLLGSVGERVIEGPEMIEVTNEKVAVAKEKLKEARTRQKSYADKHRKSLEFQPGCTWSQTLRGYKYHPLYVISYPLDQIRVDLSYVEEPKAILDHQDRVMRKKTIPFVKILWRNHPEREATWETEESIRTSYPHFRQ
nr:retrotransposon protein, putative, Ty3-gypsy subclass [Tanacetum cinerariifolium]